MYADYQSERRILSAMLHSEAACVEAVSQLKGEDFADYLHRDIFNLAVAIYTGGTFPSGAIFMREAHQCGFINDAQKLAEVSQAVSEYIDDSDVAYFINQIVSHARARELEGILNRYQSILADQGVQAVDQTVGEIVGEISSLAAGPGREELEDGQQIAAELDQLIELKESRYEKMQSSGRAVLEGLSTGFEKLNEITLGYKPGDLILLGAQTGHGKTAFSLQTARTLAVEQKIPLLYINTEMSKELIYQRLCAAIAEVPFHCLRQGNLTGHNGQDRVQVKKAIQQIRASGFVHRYCPDLSPSRCELLARQAKIQKQVQMVIIDYIGRMDKSDPRQNEWQVLEQIAKRMKILAQELNLPVMLLTQLNEDGSLQGSKRIQNECDLMLKLHPLQRDEILDKYAKYINANYRLHVGKNRDGEGDLNIALHYDKQIQQIESARFKNPDQIEMDWSDIGTEIGMERRR